MSSFARRCPDHFIVPGGHLFQNYRPGSRYPGLKPWLTSFAIPWRNARGPGAVPIHAALAPDEFDQSGAIMAGESWVADRSAPENSPERAGFEPFIHL